MKTYARRGQALMALLLIFTLFIGLLPAPALAAVWEKEGENTYVVSGGVGTDLAYAVKQLNNSGGGTIELGRQGDGSFVLTLFQYRDIFLLCRRNMEHIFVVNSSPPKTVGTACGISATDRRDGSPVG